jgi:hypothetical protein
VVLPATIALAVDTAAYPVQPVDFYFLFDSSYAARSFLYPYWGAHSKQLLRTLLLMAGNNSNFRAGLGFFTTKRLAGVGWSTDFVFRHCVDMTTDFAHLHQQFTDNATRSVLLPASNTTSGLEALLQVLAGAREGLYGFRPNSDRRVLVATNALFGVQGQAAPRFLFPLTEQIGLSAPPGPALFENNYNAVLESNCTLRGQLCPDACAVALNYSDPGHAAYCSFCHTVDDAIDIRNTTQFAPGSCEDFPRAAPVLALAAYADAQPEFPAGVRRYVVYAFTGNGPPGVQQQYASIATYIPNATVWSDYLPTLVRPRPAIDLVVHASPRGMQLLGSALGDRCDMTACELSLFLSAPDDTAEGGNLVVGTTVVNNITIAVACVAVQAPGSDVVPSINLAALFTIISVGFALMILAGYIGYTYVHQPTYTGYEKMV